MNSCPEHHKRANGCSYDYSKLLEEKEQMRLEHEKVQHNLPRPTPFDEWYDRTWKWSKKIN